MRRKTTLTEGYIYHIFNRGIERREIFLEDRFYIRFIDVINHTLKYDYPYSTLKRRLKEAPSPQAKQAILHHLETKKIAPPVQIISFALMPNHFHFTLKQLVKNGITRFMNRISLAYTKYLNTRLERIGGLFQSRFKAVVVESDEQLIHLTRYHHLNSRKLGLKTPEELINYPWSSLSDYMGKSRFDFVEPEMVLSHFANRREYLEFVLSEIDDLEPLRLEAVAIDDDFGWFSQFTALEKERKEILRQRYIERVGNLL